MWLIASGFLVMNFFTSTLKKPLDAVADALLHSRLNCRTGIISQYKCSVFALNVSKVPIANVREDTSWQLSIENENE
jgi:hypothetical protein